MKKQINQKTMIPMLAAMVCILLLIASIFLPYYTAMDEYKELLKAVEQDDSYSLYGLAELMAEEGVPGVTKALHTIIALSVLVAVLAFLRKPALIIALDLVIAGYMTLMYLSFALDPMPYYNLTFVSTLIYVVCVGVFVSAIWMMVAKKSAKKKYAATQKQLM